MYAIGAVVGELSVVMMAKAIMKGWRESEILRFFWGSSTIDNQLVMSNKVYIFLEFDG